MKKRQYLIFHRTMAALLVLFLMLSDLLPSVYASTDESVNYTSENENDTPENENGASENENGTSENENCSLEEHTHSEACYEEQKTLICGMEIGQGAENLCGMEESESHTHDETCFSGEGHVHTQECYQVERILVCEKEEHQHSEACGFDDDPAPEAASVSQLAEAGTNNTGSEIVITNYNQNFVAYNYYCFLLSTGELSVGGTVYTISGSSANRSVIIGDHTGDELNENQQPKTEDIRVELKGLTLSGDAFFEVRPVYYGANEVAATVTAASSLARLNLTENAKMTLTVNADTEISNLTLAENSQLNVIVADGVTLSLGNVTGEGSLRLSGAGTVAVSGSIAVKNLEITGATVSGSSGETTVVSATDTLTLHSGTVQNLALFGYADSVSGTRTLVLESGNFYNVAAIGVGESNTGVILNITGLNSVSLNNTNVYRDYALSYAYNGSAINGDGWLQHYRVKYQNGNAAANASTVGSRTLPQYSLAGYVFTGWLIGESIEPVTELPDSGIDGDLVLSAQMQAGEVGVTFDLGFDPTELTNDRDSEGKLPSRVTNLVSSVGADLNLTVPQRFGYAFRGWQITTGETRQISGEEASTIITYEDLTESNGAYTLNLEALWELDTFPVRLQPKIGFGSEISNLKISVDGGNTWLTFAELAAQSGSRMFWDAESETCTFTKEIQYQESLGEYFKRIFGEDSSYPILQDTRDVENGKTRFVSWKTADGTMLQADSKYEYGNGGFLDSKAQDQTLSDYQAALKGSPVVLGSVWSDTLQYFLTTDVPDGWTVLVGDKNASPAVPDENGRITLDATLPVYYRVARSSADRISNWIFTMNQGTDSLYPELEPVASGDQYLYYKFIMPNSDVTAAYTGASGAQPVYVDIAQSPITFVENISYQGLDGLTGFWYRKRMVRQEYNGMVVNAMTPLFFTTSIGDPSAYTPVTGTEAEDTGWYFYEYDSVNQNFYVTSRNVETQNQLTLVNKANVYLKDCKLMATDAYSAAAVGSKLNATEIEGQYAITFPEDNRNWAGYGSIVLNYAVNSKYDTNLYFQGTDNAVCSIFPDVFRRDFDHYTTLKIHGADGVSGSAVAMGSVWGVMNAHFDNLTITEYASAAYPDKSDYFSVLTTPEETGGDTYFRSSNVDLRHKRIYNLQSPRFGTEYDGNSSYNGTTILRLGSSATMMVNFRGNSYVRYYGDVLVRFSGEIVIDGNASVVVDGNIDVSTYTDVNTYTVNTTGYWLVKGNHSGLGVNLRNGTMIANSLFTSEKLMVNGGRIIANIMSNVPIYHSRPGLTYSGSNVPARDAIPYGGYAFDNASDLVTTKFNAGNIYLLGYYPESVAESGAYDFNVQADDPENPISGILSLLLDENGDLKAELRPGNSGTDPLTDEVLEAAVSDASQLYSDNECISFGVSSTNKLRNVSITGTEFHAAGNMNFFRDVTMTGGSIDCAGIFSSKRDLTITGGTVNAAQVGNAYNLTTTENGATRWGKTTLSNCAVTADRLGATNVTILGTPSKSTLVVGENVSVSPRTPDGTVEIVTDIYVNYVYDSSAFTFTPQVESIRFAGTTVSGNLTLSGLHAESETIFAPPIVTADNSDGTWHYGSTAGGEIHSVGQNGYVNGDTGRELVYTNPIMLLYAVKGSYRLTVAEGAERIHAISVALDGANTADVPGGNTVTLQLKTEEQAKRTIVWYTDALGAIHNAMPTRDGATIQFSMPCNDTEIRICDEITLYLDKSEIAFTPEGFRLELTSTRPDSSFAYSGNIRVRQTNLPDGEFKYSESKNQIMERYYNSNFVSASSYRIHATSNKMILEPGAGNGEGSSFPRVITLEGVFQYSANGEDRGLTTPDGEKVTVTIDGPVILYRPLIGANGDLTFVGAGVKDQAGEFRDVLSTAVYAKNSSAKYAFQKLTIPGNGLSGNTCTGSLEDCTYISREMGANHSICVGDIQFIRTRLDITTATTYAPQFFRYSANIMFVDSQVDVTLGGYMGSTSFFYCASGGGFIFDNTTLHISYHYSTAGAVRTTTLTSNLPSEVILKNGSQIEIQGRMTFNTLTLQDGSALTVAPTPGQESILQCRTLNLTGNSEATADNLLLSGFYYGEVSSEALLRDKANNTSNFLDGQGLGLTVTDGTVNVTNYLGGSRNAKITLNSGSITAKEIGSGSKLYGYPTALPFEGAPWFYCYEQDARTVLGATITINGGTVNVTENGYLGGINATVNQSGGTVNLADGAVLGMTEAQKTALADSYSSAGDSIANHTATNCNVSVTGSTVSGTGSISTPYGNISISEASGNTQVSIRNCTAESGTITIRNACDGLANPYSSGETGVSQKVGVLVSDTLSALKLFILDGAAVYADKAYSVVKADENGVLEISQDVEGSSPHTALYTGEYFGMMGSGSVVYTTVHTQAESGYQQNVYGKRRVHIHYELCDDTIDPATNSPYNPDGFLVGSFSENGYKITLSQPTRFGFDFQGWYEQPDYSGDEITQILTTNNRDIVLYARWTPRLIPFTVSVSTDKVADLVSANETVGLAGSFNGDNTVFTFNTPVLVPYRSVLIGTASTDNQVHLVDYQLATYSVTEMVWKNGGTQNLISAGSTVVSADMVNAYDAGSEALTLFVNATAKRRLLLTMDLNLKNGLPRDAVFNNTASPDQSTSTTISSYADFGKTYGDAAGFASGAALIVPSAPGYTFREWNTEANGSGETITADQRITSSSPLRLYAIWEANTYKLVFDAGDGNIVTKGSADPTASDTDKSLSGTVVYDKVINGNLLYEGSGSGADFPYAWKKGYVFEGWSFTENGPVDLKDNTMLNLTHITNLDLNGETALTLHAVYRKIKVTYNPNGGTWQRDRASHGKETIQEDAPDYGEALAGYVKGAANDATGNYVLTGTVESGGIPYAAYSTTIEGYNSGEQHDYVTNDYRGTILRKGYTFFGWYPSEEAAQAASSQNTGENFFPSTYSNAVGTVPEYRDITLYASWKPNEYSLTLHAGTSSYSTMVQNNVSNGQTVALSISDEVAGTYVADLDAKWPKRSDWYAHTAGNSDENAKRYLLGFTFDQLDPGDSKEGSAGYTTYIAYAGSVTQLIRKNAIFYKAEGETSGTIFHLPEDADYGSTIIPGTTAVPDYPTGYTIPLYAVYRERSLVFIEYVVDASGTPSRTVLGSYPYNEFVDFPAQYLNSESYRKLTEAGYKLLKWGVNSYDITAPEYPSNAAGYDANKESYKNTAASMGTFDINVYTIYAAQVTDNSDKQLTASPAPTASNVATYIYKLPMSMQTGVIKYRLLANDGSSAYNGFELVTREEMNANRYNSDYSGKIALTMQIVDASGNSVGDEVDLKNGNDLALLSESSIGAGYSIRLRMYYSSVMTEDAIETFSLKCSFFRNSTEGGQDMQQFFLLKNIQTKLTPSMYTVVYNANLPTDLNVTDWNGFDDTGKRTVVTAYGSSLLNVSPIVEGYTAGTTWTRTKADGTQYSDSGNTVSYGAPLALPVSAADNGSIYLKGAYQLNSYQLKLTTEVFDRWTVRLDGQEIAENLWNVITGEKTVNVNYHQTITFTGKTTEEPAEFILLTLADGSQSELDLYATAGTGNTYTFKMPASNVDATYQDVRTLYLEKGSITLTNKDGNNGYQQGTDPIRTWRGSYQIWMDRDNNTDSSSTSNCLVIDGDFNSRDISLGNLNITADDSIELKSDAKATLKSSNIQAKNIAVPSRASLTVNSASNTAQITLTPGVGYAAIGGHDDANGAISLENLRITMTLPAGSSASGIGAGNQTVSTGCDKVTLTNCAVVVKEGSTASSAYEGSWIGGTGVPTVRITNSTIGKSTDSQSMLGPYILRGGTVEVLSGSRIGTGDAPVNDPIYASTSLTITESNVYQRIESPLGSIAPIGTGDSGTINVEKSTILSELSGSGSSDKLYSGTLKLMDAASVVRIKGIQILDVNNGNITIDADKAVQSSETHTHTGSYLLLNEFGNQNCNLTVNGLTGNAQVQTNAMTLQTLTANGDAVLQTNGNLTVSGTTTIEADKTLSIAAEDDTVSLSGFDGKGSYSQTGGILTGTNDLIVGGNLTLDTVIANMPGKKLGSSGASGVTEVSVQNSWITADKAGAMGDRDLTFTFVAVSDDSVIDGTLIQDHYRLAYDLADANFDTTDLPAVLRSETDAEGSVSYAPHIPGEPQYKGIGTTYFRNWYVTLSNGDNVVLSETDVSGFTRTGTLEASYLDHGEDTGDGTKTLVLHAWMALNGKAMIQSGANFADMEDVTDASPSTAEAIDNGQWTARFEIQGTVIAGSKYQFSFTDPIPKGTKLTLCDRSTGTLKWYYYIAQEAVSSVSSDAFVKMGSTGDTAVLPGGNEGDVLMEKLQLTADFSSADALATDNTVSMKLMIGGQSLGIMGTTLSYTAVAAATASVEATASGTAGTITVRVSPGADNRLNGKKLYAVAVIHDADTGNAVSVPYDAAAECNDVSGMWLGGNTAAFNLGDYGPRDDTFSWSITGLPEGSYQVKWYLTAAEDAADNPFERTLAESSSVPFVQAALAAPVMTAVLTQVDGMAASGQVLTAGNAHTVSFTVETNQTSVEYWVEKQTALKNFEKRGETVGSAGNGSAVTVTIPAEEGTYRVRFSIKAGCDWDDVYYTFIVR